MNRRTTLLAGTLALVCGTGLAEAQAASRPRTAAVVTAPASASRPQATAQPRVAVIPASPPAQPVVVNTTGIVNNYGVPTQNVLDPAIPPQIVQIYYLPTIVLANGRVLAHFGTGRGYEEVLKRCPAFSGAVPYGVAVAPCFVVDSYGRYTVIHQR